MYNKLEDVKDALTIFPLQCDSIHDDVQLDLSVVAFGEDACVLVPPKPVKDFNVPQLTEYGRSNIWRGLYQALSLIDEWKSHNRELGNPYYKPWIICLSDIDMDDTNNLCEERSFKELVIHRLRKKDVDILPVGLDVDTNENILNQITANEMHPAIIKIEYIKEFILYISHKWHSLLYQSLPDYTIKDRWQDALSECEYMLIK